MEKYLFYNLKFEMSDGLEILHEQNFHVDVEMWLAVRYLIELLELKSSEIMLVEKVFIDNDEIVFH